MSRATPAAGGGRSSVRGGGTPNSRDAASESAQRSAVAGLASPGTPRMPLRSSTDEVELDSRFAAVDDNVDSFGEGALLGMPLHSDSPLQRFVLPLAYLFCSVLLLLTTSGRAPVFSEALGFGPLLRRETDLVGNVTHHLRNEVKPLLAELDANQLKLGSVNRDLEVLYGKADALAADQSRVAGRFIEAHKKVDALLHHKAPIDPDALREHVRTATVEMDELKLHAAELESLLRGKLNDFAKILSDKTGRSKDPSSYDKRQLSAERYFFKRWIEQAYEAIRPDASEFVPQDAADALVKSYVRTFSEAECSGLHDFAQLKNGAAVVDALTSATYRPPPLPGAWLWAPLQSLSGGGGAAEAGAGATYPPFGVSAGVALSKGTEPGQCWPMVGGAGKLTVQLANSVAPSSVTIMHVPPALSPNGDVTSAPKAFKVFAYDESSSSPTPANSNTTSGPKPPPKKVELISSSFDAGQGCMIFPLKRASFPVRRVTLEVFSNHGRGDLTCLYRFMVHGEPFSSLVG